MFLRAVVVSTLALFLVVNIAFAQAAPAPQPSAPSTTAANFDPDAATEAWLNKMTPAQKARGDAYFEGGYWLQLWDQVATIIAIVLILGLGWSARMRDLAEKVTRFKWIHVVIFWALYVTIYSLLTFPLAIYEGYVREHKYGLATQTFGPWFGDQAKGLLVNIVLGAIIAVPLMALARRAANREAAGGGQKSNWMIWGMAVTFLFSAFVIMIVPVFIVPIFNKVTLLNDPKVTAPILSMARANGIPVTNVYQVDASKQTTRMSANVSGLLGTTRVTLNDNLLRRGSPEEIEAVMGHEMGHYVLHHPGKSLIFTAILIYCLFALTAWGINWSLKRWGPRWRLSGRADLASIPLVLLVLSTLLFLFTPVLNTYIRIQEAEADQFGLNASRQPDGFAEAALHLGEYRKMSPGPVEEFLFYDHPSGRTRIHRAMLWKAEHLTDPVPELPAEFR